LAVTAVSVAFKSVRIRGKRLGAIIDGDPLLTNAIIAEAIGVNRETVSRWANTESVGMAVESFKRLAQYLERDERSLLAELRADDRGPLSELPPLIHRIKREVPAAARPLVDELLRTADQLQKAAAHHGEVATKALKRKGKS
jgi:transcriptional regulator with XRE-family HTH domain